MSLIHQHLACLLPTSGFRICKCIATMLIAFTFPLRVDGAEAKSKRGETTPATFSDVPYGAHFRQTMDVWLAKSAKPTPAVFYIHGGGWAAQDKTDIHQHLDVPAFLAAGISVASINYRFLMDANAAKITPPLQWPLQDAAQTSYNRVFISGCHSFDLYFLDDGRYTLTNALVRSSAQNPFTTTGDCRLTLEYVLIRRLTAPNLGTIALNSVVVGKRCTFENLDFKVTGTANWGSCLINGKDMPEGSAATGADMQALLKLMPPDYKP